jgi:nucleotide-binding universal stress UspA family protein
MARIVSTAGSSCHEGLGRRSASGFSIGTARVFAGMGPIVCAVDDSEAAEAVVRVAKRLSGALDARLVLAYIAPPTEAPGVSAAPAGQDRLREEELADARQLLEGLAARSGATDATLHAAVGAPADHIVALCAQEEAALAVVGSHGRGDVRSAVLGSVSHSVASKASCPVVIVPPGTDTHSFA